MSNQRVALGVAALLVLSAVVAGFVIFSDQATTAPRPSETPAVALDGDALVLGRAGAPHTVVVREDLTSSGSRDFDVASRDFLQIAAGQGKVRVEYRPAPDAAWQAVTQGSARKALAAHSRSYDEQAAGGSTALPQVTVDGTQVTGATGTELADAVQEQITEQEQR